VLWETELPAGGNATPAVFEAGGRQIVVIAAGGHGPLGTTRGDYVFAYALDGAR
jgi:quinoprotein glucose dehydrogenase